MEKPKLINYFHYRDFLSDFVEWKKQDSPSFSLGVWANHLNLANTASISRVISGERLPGNSLVLRLSDFFQWNSEEEVHFKKLLQKERFYRKGNFVTDPALLTLNAYNVNLIGTVDAYSTQTFLKNYGLEPVLINNAVTASLHIIFCKHSPFGEYAESQIHIAAKPSSGGFLDTGLFVGGLASNNSSHREFYKTKFQIECAEQDIKLQKTSSTIDVYLSETRILSVSLKRALLPMEEKYEMYAYLQQNARDVTKARLSIDMMGREREYLASQDHFQTSLNDPLGKILPRLNFQPTKWAVHENLFSVLYTTDDQVHLSTY